jgi:hypothetical protein
VAVDAAVEAARAVEAVVLAGIEHVLNLPAQPAQRDEQLLGVGAWAAPRAPAAGRRT